MPFEDWFKLFEEAQSLEGEDLPKLRTPSEGLPPPKMWQTRNPLGYARLTHARATIIELALVNNMPAENLISPEAIRRVCWPNPPEELDDRERFVVSELSEFGARPWQVALVLGPITAILSETEPLIVEVAPEEVTEGESPAHESD